jgi:single-stranded DNA-binding protein
MIAILAAGSLIKKPIPRNGRESQREFVTAQIKAAGDGDHFLVSLIAFDKKVCASLLALDAGDQVSITGQGKPTTWTNKEGEQCVGLSVVVQQLMTQYRLREKRKAVDTSRESFLPAASPLGPDYDEAPF